MAFSQTVDLSPLTTKECLALLDDRGFKRNRAHPDDDTVWAGLRPQ